NIPGIEGIGEKTALKYIKKYGNLENLFDHLDEIKGEKAKEKLINGQTIAFMSRKIGTIVKNAPVNFEIEDLKLTSPNWSEVESEFEKYNFTKFLEKMPKEHKEGKNKSLDEFEYEFSDDCEKYSSNLLQNSKAFTFKGIYDGENYIKSKLIFIAIKPIGEKTTIFKYNNQFVKHFKKVFESNLKKYSFDIKEEKVLFKKDGIEIFSPFDDIMLMEYLYDPTKSGYEIKESAKTFLNFEILSKDDVLGKGKNKLNFNDVKKDKLGSYLSSNLNVIEKLYDILYKKLKEFNMVFLYEDIEKKLIDVLSSMEINGFETKKEVLEEIKGEVSKKIDNLTEEIYSLSNEEFNINSTKQLGKVLFDDLKLPVIKKTKTGYSTDAKVLSALRGKHPIIEKIEDYRELYKLKSTYLESLEEEIEDDNRIRSTFNQTVTSTGRISSKDPNLQNLPIKTERGRLIRKAFVAKKGYKLIDADYSQIELRLLAHLSKDENMINAFLNGDDIHKKTASEVFHVKLDDVTKSQRSKAKAVNFGIVYGISSFGLSQNLNISRKEASDYIEGYKNSYPGVKKYMQEVVKFAKDNGYTETLYHRRRYIPEINSRNFNMRNFGERIALNTPIQGTAADIIKIAMVNVYKKLKEENVDGNLILQIHDEIILEVKESDVEVAAKILKKEMENAAKLMVPLIADVNIGENLYESK
ncbi:MAG: DNA polymerase I, partial [Peptoniphilaceae bacterium]|nr:DNA polymerase I [Peptoniphilaceae bacterium]